jgi:L-fuculose-phosphate aldolase
MNSASRELRERLADGYRQLAAEGLNRASAGNISCRLDSERMLISPTGADSHMIDAANLVEISLDGRVVGDGVPSSEWRMHAAVYQRIPTAGAIVHAHANACVALACAQRGIPAFHYMIAGFGGSNIPCTPYAAFGSENLAALAAEALVDRTACLLGRHGMLGRGVNIHSAINTAIKTEMLAQQFLLCLQAGGPVLLTTDELDEARRRYAFYGKARMPD